MMASMLACIDPGDEVIVFEPFYENYGPDAILAGAEPKYVRLREPDWRFDPDELKAAFTNRTRAIVINSPNNPDRQGVHARGAAADRRPLPAVGRARDLRRDLRAHRVWRPHARADGVDAGHGRSHHHDQRAVEDLQRDGLAHRLGDLAAVADRRHPQDARLPDGRRPDAVSRCRRRGAVDARSVLHAAGRRLPGEARPDARHPRPPRLHQLTSPAAPIT